MSELVFRSVLHTPDLMANLISIGRFDDTGFFTMFGGGKVVFKDPSRKVVMEGTHTNGLYLLGALDPNAGSCVPTAMATKSLDIPVTLDTWHSHFGHAGVTGIWNLAKKGLVDGLNMKGNMEVEGLCEDCVYRKHTTQVYNGDIEPEKEVNY